MRSILCSFLVALGLTACTVNVPNPPGQGTCPSGEEPCGSRCMTKGNSCCPDDRYSCSPGTLCNLDNQCVVSDGGQTNCAPGSEVCGSGCMPVGADCCSGQGYCDPGSVCVAGGKCQQSSAPPTSAPPNTSSSNMGACGTCSGQLECSGWIAGDLCSWQSCACYFVMNGSDTWKEFYHTDGGACFQCGTTGTTCTTAAQALVNTCYSASN